MSLLGIEDAQARLLALGAPLDACMLPLVDAVGRWASADVVAKRTQPSVPLSAMDGYAIRFDELPGPWRLVGESAAGSAIDRALGPGEAMRIFTGAPLPAGADTVLIQEEASRDGYFIHIGGGRPSRKGHDVRPAGGDFSSGETLIRAGDRFSAARIALAASAGHATLPSRRLPKVVILSTGDELVLPGEPAEGSRLPASNGPMLAALLASVEVEDRGIVPDQLDALSSAILAAAQEADVLVTTGGASVGDHDLVRPALEAAGADIDFWKVALRPGKPIMAGRLGRTVVLGLPGNPVSAFVTAELFLKPLLAHLGGARDPLPIRRLCPCGIDLPQAGSRTELLRAITEGGQVHPATDQGSAALLALGGADALIVRPAGAPPAPAGSLVEIIDIA